MGLVLGVEADVGLGADDTLGLGAALNVGIPDLASCLLAALLPVSLSLRWLLYELRLGSLYRSTVRTFP